MAMGSCRERLETPASLQCYSGIALVTKQSGGTHHVHRRYLCSKFLRQSFHEYTKESILHSRWAAAYYAQQRQKECGHHAAVRHSGSPVVGLLKGIQMGKSPVKKTNK